jgi:hypothetical protein
MSRAPGSEKFAGPADEIAVGPVRGVAKRPDFAAMTRLSSIGTGFASRGPIHVGGRGAAGGSADGSMIRA